MERRHQNIVANHWGLGRATVRNGRVADVAPDPGDPSPSPINGNIAASLSGQARILRPAVRQGWLEHGPGPAANMRGQEAFVELSWADALDLLAGELERITAQHGNQALFAGSYGWGSAGRFHHPQSQLKRFLNTIGGFVRSEGNYSYNAALVLMPHIVCSFREHVRDATRLSRLAQDGELLVMFGGLPLRNTQVSDGGFARHRIGSALGACAEAGLRCINISPLRSDADDVLAAEWLAPRPGTDVAVMMGLAHTLLSEGLHDPEFLARYTVGFERVAAYLLGESDGTAKDADWAAALSGLPARRIRNLAREMAAHRTMISCAAALQRADWGEQPLWMCVTLAAMLGQIGLPGGGYTIGYGVNGSVGTMNRPIRPGVLPQGENPVADFIPVAMVADMLLQPGQPYAYNGQTRHFPDARMVWWAGGNPFHHHQDLNRLTRAFQQPDTVVVNDLNWTATARHADIVLPVAAPEERRDIVAGQQDNSLIPAPALVPPPGDARTEFEIFSDLAARLGTRAAFTENRSEEDWLETLWQDTREAARSRGMDLPGWPDFIAGEPLDLPDPSPDHVFLADFRADPVAHPLPTPSGRIELFSQVIAAMDYDDCPGHPVWMPPRGVTSGEQRRFPLALVSGQPETRLHSQLDNGATSLAGKIAGREPVLINPADAAPRGIADGAIVELFNARGRCLAGARITTDIAPGCVFLRTGAWYDPDPHHPDRRDRHGNPNVLTHDLRSSRLSQGPASHSAFVDIAPLAGPAPEVRAHRPPTFAPENSVRRDPPRKPGPARAAKQRSNGAAPASRDHAD